jgi:DNA-binding IclR family transcriptional regulator
MDHDSLQPPRDRSWTFLSNHAAVLFLIAADPAARIDSLSRAAGISRRAAQMIVADLCRAGYVKRTRTGRRNRYTINRSLPLRHRTVRDLATVSALLAVIDRDPAA